MSEAAGLLCGFGSPCQRIPTSRPASFLETEQRRNLLPIWGNQQSAALLFFGENRCVNQIALCHGNIATMQQDPYLA